MEKEALRVVIVGTAYPYRGGLAAFNERLAREFAARGAEVSIVTFTLQYPSFLFPGKTQYSDGPAPEGLDIRRLVNSVNPLSWIRAARHIRRMAPDIVVMKYWLPYMAPALGSIARMSRRRGSRTRVVSILDNMIPHEARPGDSLLSRWFCGSVDGFVAMSESVLSDIDIFDRHRPRLLCPHPLYDQFGDTLDRGEACAALGLDPALRYLLFFGLIRDYKGLDWLLEAINDPRIPQDVRLVVAGEYYGDPAPYEAAAMALGERVIMRTGYVPDEMVRYYFCAADLVVQPYKSATQSGVTQIAAHFGRPMLVTGVGGLREMVPDGEAGYVVEPSPEAVADALAQWAEEPRDFSAGLAALKQRYSWGAMCDAVETIYRQSHDNQK